MLKGIIYIVLFLSMLTILLASSDESISSESNSYSSDEDMLIPTNMNSSVQYHLYTLKNPKNACYIEPVASIFDKCDFNSSYETKFVIHGYLVNLSPGNLFEKIKDTLLEYDKYNVIIVNWMKYNQQDYGQAIWHAFLVGGDVAAMINFITSHTGVNATSVHIIGHSLGAHIAGVAGKSVTNLGRITGLDPAGPGYTVANTDDRLTSRDANLVDAIHTSNSNTGYGFGMFYPMARINFYPNGGQSQPMCQFGKTYSDSDGGQDKVTTPADQAACFHDSAIPYFISSILQCEYLSTQCSDYLSYERGLCKSSAHLTNRMGYHCEAIPGIPDHSTFYLDTSGTSPFC